MFLRTGSHYSRGGPLFYPPGALAWVMEHTMIYKQDTECAEKNFGLNPKVPFHKLKALPFIQEGTLGCSSTTFTIATAPNSPGSFEAVFLFMPWGLTEDRKRGKGFISPWNSTLNPIPVFKLI